MNPKEKAIELVEKYRVESWVISRDHDKQCALIAVNEILNLMIKEFKWDIKHNGNIDYWQEVKSEIEKL